MEENEEDSFSSYSTSPTHSLSHRRISLKKATIITMGKGDGKKKRKKKKSSGTSSSSGDSMSSPAPVRVTTDVNIPVRQQIQFARMKKDMARQAGASFRQKKVVRSRYRRTWDEEEIEQKAEERRKKGQDPDWDVILSRNSSSPLVIVDGYNIIYKWARLKKHMVKGDLQRARLLLIDDLENLRSLKGWRIEVVFDGTGRSNQDTLGGTKDTKTATMRRANKKEVTKHGVRVVFTGMGIEADTYIEARCAQAKNVTKGRLTSSLIVATDDTMIRLAGQNAGAVCMSASRFVDELRAIKQAMRYRVEAAVAKANGRAMRPEKLFGTDRFATFGRNSVIIEDKRNQTRAREKLKRKKQLEKEKRDNKMNDNARSKKSDPVVPFWIKGPNQTEAPVE